MYSLLYALVLAAAEPGVAPADTQVVTLPGIVVSSSRTPESLMRAPAAITLVPRTTFQNSRLFTLKDALVSVPGVFVQSRAGAQDVRITIRGYGARGNGERSNTGNMRGIRVLTDGIPVSDPDGRTTLDLVDLGAVDGIEVARSNSSSVYGNASGGVVNLTTAMDFKSPWVSVDERAGSFGFHKEQGAMGFVVGRSRGSVSLSNATFQGWREHSESFSTQLHARLATPLGEVGRTRLLLLADGASNLIRFPGPLTLAELQADPKQAAPIFVTRDDRRWHRNGRLAATLDSDLGERQTLSVSTWIEPKFHQRSERNRYRDFTRLNVGGGAIWNVEAGSREGLVSRTTVGADEAFQDGAINFWSLTPAGGRGTALVANKREAANSAGGFVQQALTFHDRWSVQAGARYDNVWYIANDYLDPTLNATKRFIRVTPKVSVAWLGGRHTVFVALGGGVEAPAFNEIDPPPTVSPTSFNPFLDAMHSTTYEVGARGALGEGRVLGYDLGVYQIDVANDIIPWNGGAYFFTAGKSRRQGIEGAIDWHPTTRLTLRGSGTLSKNEYVEYVNDLGGYSGNEVAGLPGMTFAATARLAMPHGFGLEVGGEGMSRYYADDANTARTSAYGLLNAALDWTGRSGVGEVQAFVSGSNLLDKDHVASVFINGTGGRFYEPGLPLQVAAGLSLRR